MFHQSIGPRALMDIRNLQETEVIKLCCKLLESPEEFIHHARQ